MFLEPTLPRIFGNLRFNYFLFSGISVFLRSGNFFIFLNFSICISKAQAHKFSNMHLHYNPVHSTVQRRKSSEKRYYAGALCVSVKLIFIFLSAHTAQM